ncbi:autotransporter assembly complex family protein [Pseudomonas sp. F1_0610]|uniref:autotransporter assembly complex protein TamA n=1 Tax=Pseudomonas sp. F1_0610 TaxID=3114284 RepID=UPI0039C1EA10
MLRFLTSLILVSFSSVLWAQSKLEVRITPKNSALKANIEAFIGAVEKRDFEGLERFQRTAKQQAEQASQALGYYSAKITVSVNKDPNTLLVEVEPGAPVRLTHVEIRVEGEAANVPEFIVPNNKKLQVGAKLNHSVYEDAKSELQNQALRMGFFSGKFLQHTLKIDPINESAEIALVYQSGPRYKLGKVSFPDTAKINLDLLERLIPFKEGTNYHSALIAKLSQNLQSTGYFEQVRVDATEQDADENLVIPISVVLTPAKPRTMGIGLGASTDIGPRARFSWERHRVNSAGHKLGGDIEVSSPKQSVTGWYAVPLEDPLNDELRFLGGYQKEEMNDADSMKYTLGAQVRKQLDNKWQRTYFLRWEQETFKFNKGSGNNSRERTSQFLLPGVGYSILRSDSPLDPSQGHRLQFDIATGKEGVLSDADVVRATALAKGLYTFADNHRFLGRAQIGVIGTNNFNKIPPSLRFFTGGDQTVRGYSYEDISPRDSAGNRIGGRYMFASSAEYQYTFAPSWRVAAFIDQGAAANNLTDSIKTSIGMGVRWVSPVGPLRLDLAKPMHDKENGWRIHFSMGPEL